MIKLYSKINYILAPIATDIQLNMKLFGNKHCRCKEN